MSRPISRVLSRTVIHLGPPSPTASSDLPESTAGHGIAFLFGLAPGGVYLAAACYHLRGALLPHHFTLTPITGRYPFCCTFRGLAPPRRYLAPCPAEPGLSSPGRTPARLPGWLRDVFSGIQEGLNPRVLETLLKTYLPGNQRESTDAAEE